VIEGYEAIGQYPLNLDKAMGQCTTLINKPMFELMRNKWEALANIFRTKGVLTEEDMNVNDIPFADFDLGNKPKDARALHKQRAVVMNSQICIQQYKDYAVNKELQDQITQHNRLQREFNRTENHLLREKRDRYNNWLCSLSNEQRKLQRRMWKEAGNIPIFIQNLDINTIPIIDPIVETNAFDYIDGEEVDVEEEPLVLVIPTHN
jgi:hypothetical protein